MTYRKMKPKVETSKDHRQSKGFKIRSVGRPMLSVQTASKLDWQTSNMPVTVVTFGHLG